MASGTARRSPAWLGLVLASPPALATGAEMAGLRGAVMLLIAVGAVSLQLLCLLIESWLPRRWPRLARWLAAAVAAPVALAAAWAAYSLFVTGT